MSAGGRRRLRRRVVARRALAVDQGAQAQGSVRDAPDVLDDLRGAVAPRARRESVRRCADSAERIGELGGGRGEVHRGGIAASRSQSFVDPPQEKAGIVEDTAQTRGERAVGGGVLQQHLGVADDVVQRGSQLVAEMGQRGGIAHCAGASSAFRSESARAGGAVAASAGSVGSRTMNVLPRPGSLDTATSPPISRHSRRESASPRPVPP